MEDEAPRTAEIIIIIRPSFKKFCGADACRAALFNHLLYWIAQKCKGQPADTIKKGELYWYGSVEEEICTGMDHSWSAWKIRKELDALTKEPGALIGKRHNPVKGWDREYQYFIGEEQGQAIRNACKQHGVDLLGLRLDADVLHLLKTVNAIDENSKSIQRKQQMDLRNSADPFAENSGAIPKVSTKGSSKDTDKDTAPEPEKRSPSLDQLAAEVSFQLEDRDHEEENKKEMWEIFKQARAKKISEAKFEHEARSALAEVKDMSLEEIRTYEHENHIRYYFWYLCFVLNITFKQPVHA